MLLPLYEEYGRGIRWVRDVTRGGLFTILNEGITNRKNEMIIKESDIPVDHEVQSICDILGLDPFYLANEGKVVMVVDSRIAGGVVKRLQKHRLGRNAAIIGHIRRGDGHVYIETVTGGLRIAEPLLDDPVPRIC
jgi:hydrogenase expression/formation protein HypE